MHGKGGFHAGQHSYVGAFFKVDILGLLASAQAVDAAFVNIYMIIDICTYICAEWN